MEKSITSIGDGFMSNCTAFNQPLVIPEGVTSIGHDFLSGCDSLVSTVTVNCPATAFLASKNSFATTNPEAPCYVTGIRIAGPYTKEIMALFPNRTSSPYRKLIAAQ